MNQTPDAKMYKIMFKDNEEKRWKGFAGGPAEGHFPGTAKLSQPVVSAREQMKRRNTYCVHAMLSPSKAYYT